MTSLALDQLRSLEEDLHVLHSNVLKQSSIADTVTTLFGRAIHRAGRICTLMSMCDANSGRSSSRKSAACFKQGEITRWNYDMLQCGGTTAALRCGWDLRRDFPVTVLRQYSTTTADRIDQLFRISQKPVLLIADAALLPAANREDLYRDVAKRNVRCVILYVVRTFGDQLQVASEGDPPTDRLEITDPMTDHEAQAFLRAFSARTNNPNRQRLLLDLATTEQWKPYRSPFFFGLTTYEDEFESVHSYVEHHLTQTLTQPIKKLIRFLALLTKYSQTGISIGLLNQFLGLDPASDIGIADALGDVVARLIVRRGQLVRLPHPVIAREVLQQSIGGKDWKYGLRDLCLQFVAETVGFLGTDGVETLHLFSELFIRRDYWTPSARRRRNFSELILDIPVPAGRHQVLLALTDTCPQEPHFWNHLGRHHIYEMRQDFAEAERYLKVAVDLNPDEQVHHHSLGMVRRFWIRSLIADMLRREPPPTAENMLEAVQSLFDGAAEEFAIARKLGPEDNHGYITHIQLILEILENLVRLDINKTLPALLGKTDTVGDWARASVVVAEDLLRQVQHLREQEAPSRYELFCTNSLAALYGHFDAVISSLDALSKSVQDADVRRALATAYFSKSGRVWAKLSPSELRHTKDLMEDNLRTDPTNERDIRSWFQAFRRLPEFSYIDAIDRLEGWARASNQVDAYYYLYILHFLRWLQGAERDEHAMRASLDQCRQRAVGKRGFSYEWLAKEPTWCPLAHANELGAWDEFYEKTESLDWVTGSIASIKPQAGTIRLGAQTVAYFVPGTKFSETRHLNSLVKCYIGFSYEGLRAWSVDFVAEDGGITGGRLAEGKRSVNNISGGESVIARTSPADLTALTRSVDRFIQDQLATSINRNKPLLVAALGNYLLYKFGRPTVHERLGFRRLKDFLQSIPSIDLVGEGASTVVVKANIREIHASAQNVPMKGPVAQPLIEASRNDLRKEIRAELMLLLTSTRDNPSVSLAFLGNVLRKRFGLPLTYRRLGFLTLKDLVKSYDEFEVDAAGNVRVFQDDA